ncbi:MAG: hypothetical protein FJZ38_15110 [Candidatus Rokubacteria bacterium]|nr:hypothetical protein [Candidatus Rokubacteria bacterium]
MSRAEAVEALAEHGISGGRLYLIDVIPLIDMLWADGRAESVEVELLHDFVRQHVDAINELAGTRVLTHEEGIEFLRRFLASRPSEALLTARAEKIAPVRLATSDASANRRGRQTILEWCLDIGAAAVSEYPYGVRERFCRREKERFLAILAALGGPR